ncbi:C40 family peptidase [uncultured Desulfovibrio sp.]|uniref:C40 family peptidase n=1 Tax=uncultured Desulfovibrio sp. TaxID=167968 RepID=UPI00265CF15A|nr:C40 family peptidase [uncultured Desulfovibrio sp.]
MRLVPRLLIPLAMGLLALSAGCASHSGSGSSGYPEESWYAQRQRAAQEARFRRSYEAVFDESVEESGPRQAKAVQVARSAIGTPYVPGGRNPGGFDCSGLVQWAYKSVGINLPRTAREQSAVGKRITRVEDMRAGDIVAFHHPRRGYHTGIYVGDGKFVHSPRRRTRVRINSLDDPYFRTTFMGARRVEGSDAFSAEELRMAAYAEEQAVREISHSRSKSKAGVSQKNTRDKKSSVQKKSSRSKSKSSVQKKSGRSNSKSSVQKQDRSKKSSSKQGRNIKK